MLVDGPQHRSLPAYMAAVAETIPHCWLLEDSSEAQVKSLGPLLVSFVQSEGDVDELYEWFYQQEAENNLLSWVWSRLTLARLAEHFRPFLFSQTPDGKRALLRWYDPYVRLNLESVLHPEQRQALMAPIQEWWIWDVYEAEYKILLPEIRLG